MASYAFAAGLEMTSTPSITSPPAAHKKDAIAPAPIEVDNYNFPQEVRIVRKPYNHAILPAGAHTPHETQTPAAAEAQTPKTPNELESSYPSTPQEHTATVVVPSWSYPSTNKWRVLCACVTYFGNGMNDAGRPRIS